MFKFFLVFLLYFSYSTFAQNKKDSLLSMYEMHPLIYTEKIDKDYFTIQNYFSKKKWFVNNGDYVFGLHDSIQNYGVLLEVEKSKSKIIITQCEFLVPTYDTIYLKHRVFYVTIAFDDNIKSVVPLSIKDMDWTEIKENERFKKHSLIRVVFDPVELSIGEGQKVFINTKYKEGFAKYIPISFVSAKNKFTYTQEGDLMKPIIMSENNTYWQFKQNLVWQVRVKYRAY